MDILCINNKIIKLNRKDQEDNGKLNKKDVYDALDENGLVKDN